MGKILILGFNSDVSKKFAIFHRSIYLLLSSFPHYVSQKFGMNEEEDEGKGKTIN